MANNIQLDIKVNAETGQLEVLGAKFEGLADKGGKAQGAFAKLGGEAAGLVKSMLPLATAGGIVAFFAGAVKGAEEEAQAMNRLKFVLESTGQSWDKNKQVIDDWAKSIQTTTRFSDGQALGSLEKLARSTGNVAQAQKASQLAMSLSVASGKDLGETTDFVNGLLNKQERALTIARKEFGSYIGDATTAQGALDALGKKLENAAFQEENLTKSMSQAKNSFGELADQVGSFLAPALIVVADLLKQFVGLIENVATAFAGLGAMAVNVFTGIGNVMKAAFDMDWNGIKAAAKQTMSDIAQTTLETASMMEAAEEQRTQKAIQQSGARLMVKAYETDEEVRKKQEAAQKLEAMENELDQRILQLGTQTTQEKLRQVDLEVQRKLQAAQKIKKAGQDTAQYEAQVAKWAQQQKAVIAQQDLFVKQELAFQTIQTSIQTLQALNSLGDKGSSAERTRAKALLALQQATTIGWIWVAAAKTVAETPGGFLASPGVSALAAAQTALAVANFVVQSKNIDRAASAEQQGLSGISLNAPAPGIDLGAGGNPVGGGDFGGGGITVRSSGGGGGGGGSGGTVINANIYVNFSTEKLAVDNVDLIMRRFYERLRQGTTEGIQMALQIRNVADQNSNLAV